MYMYIVEQNIQIATISLFVELLDEFKTVNKVAC